MLDFDELFKSFTALLYKKKSSKSAKNLTKIEGKSQKYSPLNGHHRIFVDVFGIPFPSNDIFCSFHVFLGPQIFEAFPDSFPQSVKEIFFLKFFVILKHHSKVRKKCNFGMLHLEATDWLHNI